MQCCAALILIISGSILSLARCRIQLYLKQSAVADRWRRPEQPPRTRLAAFKLDLQLCCQICRTFGKGVPGPTQVTDYYQVAFIIGGNDAHFQPHSVEHPLHGAVPSAMGSHATVDAALFGCHAASSEGTDNLLCKRLQVLG